MKATARAIGLAGCLWAGLACAHDADVIYARVSGRSEALLEVMTLTPGALSQLAPLDADGDGALSQGDLEARRPAIEAGVWDDAPLSAGGVACERLGTTASLKEGFVALEARFRCGPGDLRQDFRLLRVLPANFRVALGSQYDGERGASAFAQGASTSITLPRPSARSAQSWKQAFERGLERALSGPGWAALIAVLIAMGRLGRAVQALAFVLVGLCAGVGVEAPVLFADVLLVALTTGMTLLKREPPVVAGLVGGLAIGLRLGGGAFPEALAMVGGALVVLIPIGLGGAAVGLMLRRRSGAWRWVRWSLPVLVSALTLVR